MENVTTFEFACEANVIKTDVAPVSKPKHVGLPDYMLGDNLRSMILSTTINAN